MWKGVWANAVKFLTEQKGLSSRGCDTSCDNHMIKTNMAVVCVNLSLFEEGYSVLSIPLVNVALFSPIHLQWHRQGGHAEAHAIPTTDCALPIVPNTSKLISLTSVY